MDEDGRIEKVIITHLQGNKNGALEKDLYYAVLNRYNRNTRREAIGHRLRYLVDKGIIKSAGVIGGDTMYKLGDDYRSRS